MKEISSDQLKKLQVEMLKKIHGFCEEKELCYFLAYGTLIGAIRHKGYIPWDDDIDIMMPRKDYNKFINTFNGFYSELKVFSPELNIDYYAPYTNVVNTNTVLVERSTLHRGFEMGVKIDVFPIDTVPQDLEEYNLFSNRLESFNDILRWKRSRIRFNSYYKSTIILIINKIKYCFVKYRTIQKEIIKTIDLEKKSNSVFVDNAVFPVYKKKRFNKDLISSIVKVEFEGETFNAPVGYDKILRIIYGDYMTLPPEEKRIPHHGFTAFWKD